MSDICDEYQQYAFLPDPAIRGTQVNTVVDASLIGYQQVARSYDEKWYFVVFKPFDRSYLKDPHWYQVKGLERCRKSLRQPLKAYVMTREIDANKTHINALVCSGFDYMSIDGSVLANKYKLHVQLLPSPADRHNVLRYIQKESAKRSFVKYLDYITSP